MCLNKIVICKVILIESFESLFNFKLIFIKGMNYKIFIYSFYFYYY